LRCVCQFRHPCSRRGKLRASEAKRTGDPSPPLPLLGVDALEDGCTMVDDKALRAALPSCLYRTDLAALGEKYEGKVRDNYTKGGHRFIVVTDRISAFDRVLGTVPFKG